MTSPWLARFIVPLLCLFPRLVLAQPALNQGPMVRLGEREWDFGQVPQAGHYSHKFHIANEGTEDLKILSIEVNCGCTAAIAGDSLLAPGEGTEIEVTYSSKESEGEELKIVTLRTNDPAEPRIDIRIRADVRPFIRVDTRKLDFEEVRRGETPSLSSTFEADPGDEFEVLDVQGAEDWVTWSIERLPGGRSYRVTARLKRDAPYGRFMKRANLSIKHAHRMSESVEVKGFVYSYFKPERGNVNLAAWVGGKEVERKVKIEADGSRPFRVTDAVPSVPYLSTHLAPEGNGYLLTVTLASRTEAGRLHDAVTLKTTDPAQPEITIKVDSTVRPRNGGSPD